MKHPRLVCGAIAPEKCVVFSAGYFAPIKVQIGKEQACIRREEIAALAVLFPISAREPYPRDMYAAAPKDP